MQLSTDARRTRIREIQDYLGEMAVEWDGSKVPTMVQKDLDAARRELVEHQAALKRQDDLIRSAADRGNVESGDGTGNGRTAYADSSRRADRDSALRAIDKNSAHLSAEAGNRIETLVRERDPLSLAGRYIAAVGEEAYLTGFAKMLVHPQDANLRFTAAEAEAVQRVSEVMHERAMSEGSGATGLFGAPFQLDPTIILTGTGSLNPLRQMARVETISGYEWRGVTTDQVVAHYQAEGSEVTDDSPTLVQPSVRPQRGTAFVPLSMELQQDYTTLTNELGRAFADARDNLDAQMMVTGNGTNQPVGILSVGTAGALTTAQRVQTAAVATFAYADVWALRQALPARFLANAQWLAHPTVIDKVFQFVAKGDTTDADLMPDGRGGDLIGKPVNEISSMVTTDTTTGSRIAVYGDFSTGVLIADRLGFSVEVIPHLFGAAQRPTGQRGVLAVWRTGVGVIAPNALRYLEVK